jgi:hypothetical protein
MREICFYTFSSPAKEESNALMERKKAENCEKAETVRNCEENEAKVKLTLLMFSVYCYYHMQQEREVASKTCYRRS